MSYTNSTAGTALNAPANQRQLIDGIYVVTASLPNAANTVNTSGLDLLQAVPYPVTDRVDVNIISAAGLGNNNKNINYVLQDSADNSTFANVVYLAAPLFQVLDNGNTNTNAANVVVKLMPGTRRYIRVQATGEANGGVGTNGLTTLQLLF